MKEFFQAARVTSRVVLHHRRARFVMGTVRARCQVGE
jgi:hypothetical protein